MDPDSSSLIPLAFVAISLAAYALAVRAEAGLAEAERLERLQQAVAPRSPRSPLLGMLDRLPMGAALGLSIIKNVVVAAAVLSERVVRRPLVERELVCGHRIGRRGTCASSALCGWLSTA